MKKPVVISIIALIGVISIAALVLGIVAVVQVNKDKTSDDEVSQAPPSTTQPPLLTTTAVDTPDFPASFEFGSATSAYQIEGAWNVGGRSPSIWDDAVHDHPEIISDRSNGDEAADSYHRYKEDVKALKDSGFQYYRFSISWSRVLPIGGHPNQEGINYYSNLINELILNGIKPMITLYHWDLPHYVQQLGGWTNPIVVDYFEQYANLVFEKFGDRVKTFITFNEPYIFCEHGYGKGIEPPLIKSPGVGVYECGKNVLLAHARAYHLYKEKYAAWKGQVGICLNHEFFWPHEGVDQKIADQANEHLFGWFAHPIFSKEGNYPQVMIDNIKRNSGNRPWSRLPALSSEEIDYIKGTGDFLAINYYSSRYVKPKANLPDEFDWEADAGIDRIVDPSWSRGRSSWLYNVPKGLHDLLIWIKDSYDNPTVVIAENGYSDDGDIEDDERIEYIKGHLKAVKEAMNEGCKVVAYTVWSLLDNFEWLQGYTERFGIYYIDFHTKKRIPKKSSRYFKQLIETRKI